jgi:hypothetical protein
MDYYVKQKMSKAVFLLLLCDKYTLKNSILF